MEDFRKNPALGKVFEVLKGITKESAHELNHEHSLLLFLKMIHHKIRYKLEY
jgi:hypothetical protein